MFIKDLITNESVIINSPFKLYKIDSIQSLVDNVLLSMNESYKLYDLFIINNDVFSVSSVSHNSVLSSYENNKEYRKESRNDSDGYEETKYYDYKNRLIYFVNSRGNKTLNLYDDNDNIVLQFKLLI